MKTLPHIAAIGCLAVGSHALAEPPQYALRFLGDGAKVEGINAHGVVTGWRLSPSPARAFVSGIDHPYMLLPLPAGFTSSLSWDLNDAGVVVGEVAGGGQQVAAAWHPDGDGGYTVELLGALPGHDQSIAYAINNRGDIVGESVNPGWAGGPAVWFNAPGGIAELGAPSHPTAVNDHGLVVGWSGGMFDLDTMSPLALPPGMTALIWDVNNHGDLAGASLIGHDALAGVRWTETFGWQVIGAPADPSFGAGAYAINDDHVTAGQMVSGTVYYDTDGLRSLHALLAPEFQLWAMDTRYCAINEAGQIATVAWNDSLDIGGAAVLTPLGTMIIPGDVNGDAIVDLDDHCAWQADPIDLDGDGDADGDDEQWLIERLASLGFIVADCNDNGRGDHCDIVDGISLDCDGNGVPDECQPDCNGDGIPDACEPDCNDNGVPDPCDIAGGTSEDCNDNGIPDECDGGGVAVATVTYDPPLPMFISHTIVEDVLVVDSGIVDDVDFMIDLRYRIGYLSVALTHGETTVMLIDRPGHPEVFLGNGQLGYAPAILDDEGTGGPIEDEGQFGSPFEPIVSPPSYTPNEPLSAFDGMPVEGIWTVTVTTIERSSPGDGLHGWGLTITQAGVEVPPCCTADFDESGIVDIGDLLVILTAWGTPDGDATGDGTTDVADLLELLTQWGPCA